MKDTRVLEKASDDRTHANTVAAARDTWPEATDPPDHLVNGYAGTTRFTERGDDFGVLKLVHLGHDARRAPGPLVFDLPRDQFQKPPAHGRRCHQELVALRGLRVSGQVMEQGDDVMCKRWIAREEAHIGIEPGGPHMVIPGTDMHVPAQPAG